jgi:hypothetical protein
MFSGCEIQNCLGGAERAHRSHFSTLPFSWPTIYLTNETARYCIANRGPSGTVTCAYLSLPQRAGGAARLGPTPGGGTEPRPRPAPGAEGEDGGRPLLTGPSPYWLSHRPRLLVPRHLPEHPLVPRADDERLLQTRLLIVAGCLRPRIHFLPHPLSHFLELR